MLRPLVGRLPLAICGACLLHLIWAVGLILDPAAVNATATHALLLFCGNAQNASTLVFFVACLALFGIIQGDPTLRALLALPQQFVLAMSAFGCVEAMYLAQFADGVTRARWFLIVDQVPVVIMTLTHTLSLGLMLQGAHHDARR